MNRNLDGIEYLPDGSLNVYLATDLYEPVNIEISAKDYKRIVKRIGLSDCVEARSKITDSIFKLARRRLRRQL